MKLKFLISIFTMLFLVSTCTKEKEKKVSVNTENDVIELNDSATGGLSLITAAMGDYVNPLVVVGEVSFDEDHVVHVFPIVSGSVEKVFVSLGDYVKKGQLLANVLSTDISEYQRNFNIAKANLEVTRRNFERVKALFEDGFASEKELNIADNDLRIAQSDYNAKRQILELYGGSTSSDDALFRIFAPNNGYIVMRNINEGMQIRTDNSSNLFTISDLNTVWIWANVYESDISKIQAGNLVKASTISYPDLTFTGQIAKISNILDPESRVVKVRTEISNPGELLKPEMFATVEIYPKSPVHTLAVPTKAIFLEHNLNYIIIKKDNKYAKRRVERGLQFDQVTEIKSGLAAGEVVVVDGALFVANEINIK